MRHTACTRMAECRMDVKVLQYIMGHAHIDVTMEVYNHIGELTRIENEIARLDSMVLNAWHHKKKNWCQIGVKTEKITISKEIRYCKPLILKGLQKNNKNISTHLLTVLIMRAIVQIEQRKRDKESKIWSRQHSYKIQTSGIPKFQQTTPRNSPIVLIINFYHLEGDMTYDDA